MGIKAKRRTATNHFWKNGREEDGIVREKSFKRKSERLKNVMTNGDITRCRDEGKGEIVREKMCKWKGERE
jgi:hypothetical protein